MWLLLPVCYHHTNQKLFAHECYCIYHSRKQKNIPNSLPLCYIWTYTCVYMYKISRFTSDSLALELCKLLVIVLAGRSVESKIIISSCRKCFWGVRLEYLILFWSTKSICIWEKWNLKYNLEQDLTLFCLEYIEISWCFSPPALTVRWFAPKHFG